MGVFYRPETVLLTVTLRRQILFVKKPVNKHDTERQELYLISGRYDLLNTSLESFSLITWNGKAGELMSEALEK